MHRLPLSLASVLGLFLIASLAGCGSGRESGTPLTNVATTKNPLVAQYDVTTFDPASVWVEFGPDASYGRQTSMMAASDSSPRQATVLVAGMKAKSTYHMRAHVEYPDGTSWVDADHTFKTGPLPSYNQLTLTVTRPSPSLNVAQSGVELLDVTATGTKNLRGAVADLDGNIIWYQDFNSTDLWPFPIKTMPNGDILLNLADELREINLVGDVIRTVTVSGDLNSRMQLAGFTSFHLDGIHHDIATLPNGHLILLGNATKTFTNLPGYPGDTRVIGDVLVDLDPDWNPVWTWSSFDHLDINRHLMGLPDWTHSNAVIYSPDDGNLMVSMRHQSWVIKIDYADGNGTGGILWRLGNEGDFSIDGGDPSQWFYAQHYPQIVSDSGSLMTLTIFDNGNLREDDVGNQCTGSYPACYSRAILMQVDESAKTASVQWQDAPGYYSFWGGSIGVLENGDVEFAMSSPFANPIGSRIMEVTQTATPEIVWQMDIAGGNAYRAYRIPSLYPGVTWH